MLKEVEYYINRVIQIILIERHRFRNNRIIM